jgi:hypothetical protein
VEHQFENHGCIARTGNGGHRREEGSGRVGRRGGCASRTSHSSLGHVVEL